MPTAKWKRYKKQEGGNVFRWFEKGGTIASVVEGYFPEESNIRISGIGFDSIEVRGHKSVILKWSDAELTRKFDMYIKREKERIKKEYGWKLYYAIKGSDNWHPLTKGWYNKKLDAIKSKKYYEGAYAKKYSNSWVDTHKLKVKKIEL